MKDFFSCYLQGKYELAWLRGHRKEGWRVFQAVNNMWKCPEAEKSLYQPV